MLYWAGFRKLLLTEHADMEQTWQVHGLVILHGGKDTFTSLFICGHSHWSVAGCHRQVAGFDKPISSCQRLFRLLLLFPSALRQVALCGVLSML